MKKKRNSRALAALLAALAMSILSGCATTPGTGSTTGPGLPP